MGIEDQALIVHSKRSRRRPHYSKGKNSHSKDNNRKDLSKVRCYACYERGHYAKDHPKNRFTLIKGMGTK